MFKKFVNLMPLHPCTDEMREEAHLAMKQFRDLNCTVTMLTGDDGAVAAKVTISSPVLISTISSHAFVVLSLRCATSLAFLNAAHD